MVPVIVRVIVVPPPPTVTFLTLELKLVSSAPKMPQLSPVKMAEVAAVNVAVTTLEALLSPVGAMNANGAAVPDGGAPSLRLNRRPNELLPISTGGPFPFFPKALSATFSKYTLTSPHVPLRSPLEQIPIFAVCPGALGHMFINPYEVELAESQIVGKFGLLKLPNAVVFNWH
jgi:hypothetical protein